MGLIPSSRLGLNFLHRSRRQFSPSSIHRRLQRRMPDEFKSNQIISARRSARRGETTNPAEMKKQIRMQIKVLVIDKVSETFDTKKGSKTLHLLVCQDQSRPPLRNSFDYEMTADELSKHGATLVDKQIELNVRDMTQNFSGRIRMSGAITKVGA